MGGFHVGRDGTTDNATHRDERFAVNALDIATKPGVVGRHIHLPSRVVRKIELVGRLAHSKIVRPAVTEADGRCRSHDAEGGVLGLVAKPIVPVHHDAVDEIDALHHVSIGRVAEDRVSHVLLFL